MPSHLPPQSSTLLEDLPAAHLTWQIYTLPLISVYFIFLFSICFQLRSFFFHLFSFCFPFDFHWHPFVFKLSQFLFEFKFNLFPLFLLSMVFLWHFNCFCVIFNSINVLLFQSFSFAFQSISLTAMCVFFFFLSFFSFILFKHFALSVCLRGRGVCSLQIRIRLY